MTPLQEQITRVAVSCLMAIIVIFICGFVVTSIISPAQDVMSDPMVKLCRECHTNLNATENVTACDACKKIWSNVYT